MSAISFKIKVGCFCPTIFLKLFYKTPRLFKAPVFQPVALSSSPFLMNGSPSEQALAFYHIFLIRQVIVTMILTFINSFDYELHPLIICLKTLPLSSYPLNSSYELVEGDNNTTSPS